VHELVVVYNIVKSSSQSWKQKGEEQMECSQGEAKTEMEVRENGHKECLPVLTGKVTGNSERERVTGVRVCMYMHANCRYQRRNIFMGNSGERKDASGE